MTSILGPQARSLHEYYTSRLREYQRLDRFSVWASGKLVAISQGKLTRTGEEPQLGLTADNVSKLLEVKEQSWLGTTSI